MWAVGVLYEVGPRPPTGRAAQSLDAERRHSV